MAWTLLLAAGILEIVMAISFRYAEGWTRPGPSALGIVTALGSFSLLTLALRTLPVGTAYAVWTGIGACGVALVGIIAFGESASPARLALLGLVLVGTIGLRLID